MIRKASSSGIGCSIVDLGEVRHVFAAAVPRSGGNLEEQARDALETIRSVIDAQGNRKTMVKQSVFLRDAEQINTCRRIMRDFYGDELPATTYVPQSPCEGKLLAIEACGVGRRPGEAEIERFGQRLVVARHDDITWGHCYHISPKLTAGSVYDRTMDALAEMKRCLAQAGLGFEHVVRTWLYLGDIVGLEGPLQRYQELNRARSDFYGGVHFGNKHVASGIRHAVYPASTGIGVNGNDILMSCIALSTPRNDVRLVPLENPQQTSAFDYAADHSDCSPKFARAMAVTTDAAATIFISGTASITNEASRHAGDAAAQTHQILDNIVSLISADNFARHGQGHFGATLGDLAHARVYVKNQSDYETVHAICQARLGQLPTIYAVADICRPELLVEIEGVAFARRRDGVA